MGLLGMPLHFIYPFMKRWTWWPQAWLGEKTQIRPVYIHVFQDFPMEQRF